MISWKDYQYDLENTLSFCSDIAKLEGKSILITGSTGLIGSYLIDLLAYYNIKKANKPVSIYALSRSDKNITQRFGSLIENEWFHSVIQDITTFNDKNISVDYIINGASNAHPALYAKDPIGTITTNVFGTYNMLKFAAETDVERVLQVSTVEIYGENRGDVSSFNESYCGVLNCNNARGGYPESKRVSETLCHAFIDANDLDIVIVRPCRIYGPTMNMSDSKATAQFIKSAVAGTDITLKSAGTQQFSYAYVGDVVSAIICVLLNGVKGEAYNISDRNSDIHLRELAEIAAEVGNAKVIFEQANAIEQKGFSGSINAILDSSKLEALGWNAETDIKEGVKRTVNILKNAL